MTRNTVKLTRGQDVGVILNDKGAGAAITPGELVEIAADGDLQPHSTAEGNAQKLIALEDPDREAPAGTKTIDHDYSADDEVRYIRARTGGKFLMFLANGENVSEGDPLFSDGAGALQAAAGTASTSDAQRDSLVGYAAEDLNNSSGSPSRIAVWIA